VARATARVAALDAAPRLPRRLEVSVRYDDGTQVVERGPLEAPTLDAATVRGAAAELLDRTGYEWDGRGVTMVGVTLPLPAAATSRGGRTRRSGGP
jgi:DNA polymerase-4